MSSRSKDWGRLRIRIHCRSEWESCMALSKYAGFLIGTYTDHIRCGFCTPGIVMSLYAVIRNAYDPTTNSFDLSEEEIEMKGHLDGNLCRCTGYKPILQIAKTFVQEDLKGRLADSKTTPSESSEDHTGDVEEYSPHLQSPSTTSPCGRPGGCCRDGPSTTCSPPSSPASQGSSRTSFSSTEPSPKSTIPQFDLIPYSPASEIIFPPSLYRHVNLPVCYGDVERVWLRPVTLTQLVDILVVFPMAKLVCGASEMQVDVRFKGSHFPVSVFVGDIDELATIHVPEDPTELSEFVVGGNVSLSDVEETCRQLSAQLGKRGTALAAMAKVLRYFAGRQIRNAASLAGNIATASPISDMNPLLLAVNATVVTLSPEGERSIPMNSMFLGYRKTALPEGAVITEIRIPLPPPNVLQITMSYKQAKRKDDDIAIVTAAFCVTFDGDGVVTHASLAYGGMAPTTVLAHQTGTSICGRKWNNKETLYDALRALTRDFGLPYGVPGGMATYRSTLALSLFFRFWNEAVRDLNLGASAVELDCVDEIHREISTGSRDDDNPHEQRVVGKQIPHLSGLKHATGEAEYVDDIPPQARELCGALVLSQRAHAKIVSVDWTPAIGPGLAVGYIDRHSIPIDRNLWGSVNRDEPFFATDEVYYHGQPIGMVYAATELEAQAAARAVRVEYEDLPAILTIDQAIEARSFFHHGKELRKGAPPDKMADVFARCDRVFTGVTRVGGQEHFYLETNAAMVIPHVEDGTMEVWSSTQNT